MTLPAQKPGTAPIEYIAQVAPKEVVPEPGTNVTRCYGGVC